MYPSVPLVRGSLHRTMSDPTRCFLLLLVLADLAFFMVHLLYAPDGLFDDERFRLDWDRGYAETFQYIKALWIVALLLYAALRARSSLLLTFAAFFAYLGLDDAVRLHERIGGTLIGSSLPDIPLPGGILRGYDWGQTLYAVVVGLAMLFAVLSLYRRSTLGVRRTARTLLLLLVTLAYFGVANDVLIALLPTGPWDSALVFFEEAGEHLVMSTILGYLFVLMGRPHPFGNAAAR